MRFCFGTPKSTLWVGAHTAVAHHAACSRVAAFFHMMFTCKHDAYAQSEIKQAASSSRCALAVVVNHGLEEELSRFV